MFLFVSANVIGYSQWMSRDAKAAPEKAGEYPRAGRRAPDAPLKMRLILQAAVLALMRCAHLWYDVWKQVKTIQCHRLNMVSFVD